MRTWVVATLSISYVLLAETCFSATFSSKIIHRFSDEARSIWASRSGERARWPERHGAEYVRLLLSNDARRQRLNLLTKNQLLVPSEGSRTVNYGNELGSLHYTWIDIGTPNISFLVALDTGSDMLWVPCECIQCAPLSSNYYDTLDRDLSEYSPSLSSTSKNLTCGHHLCQLGPNCRSPNEHCPYIINYKSENTSSSGFLFEDKLHLASVGRRASQASLLQTDVIIGCGRKQTGSYEDKVAPDGLMGLGPGDISVPSMLAKSGFIRHSFSFCFDEADSGRLFFGDEGPATQKFTPFSPFEGKYVGYFVDVDGYCIGKSCVGQIGFQALVDCGSSFTYLPYETYRKVAAEFDKQMNATRSGIEEFPYCYKARSMESLQFPNIKVTFSMNQSFAVDNPMFAYGPSPEEVDVYCLGVLPSDDDVGLIGQNFMVGYRMVFDWENLKLGWSHSNCEDPTDEDGRGRFTPPLNDASASPLPMNDWQKPPPNRHAVAPAIAGRAPHFKASAGSPGVVHFYSIWECLLLLLPLCTVNFI